MELAPCHMSLLIMAVLVTYSSIHVPQVKSATILGFYSSSCPNVEKIITQRMRVHFSSDRTIAPALLRMFFHDCFVSGCDASLLLDSVAGTKAEKEASPNRSVRGYNVIDDIKAAVEKACPGVVSCADIMAFATRDAVVLAGGPKYQVGGGRLDSFSSRSSDANILPSPSLTVEQAAQSFASQGFSEDEMVALLGGHTLGITHCGFISDRLFNFEGTRRHDPSMNPSLFSRLSRVCSKSSGGSDPELALDQGTISVFDTSFYRQLTLGNGILFLDQALNEDPSTAGIVSSFTNKASFFPAFVHSMKKLGELKIKQSPSQGEIRLNCARRNPRKQSPPALRNPPPPPPLRSPPPPPKAKKPKVPSSPPNQRTPILAPPSPPVSVKPPVFVSEPSLRSPSPSPKPKTPKVPSTPPNQRTAILAPQSSPVFEFLPQTSTQNTTTKQGTL